MSDRLSQRGAHGLLERGSEVERIGAGIEAACEGTGEVLVVEGPAGIGKSALLDAAAGIAVEREAGVLSARATELERELPFGVARQLLEPPVRAAPSVVSSELLEGSAAHAAPALGLAEEESAQGPAPGFATLNGLYWLVANLAEREPLVICLDDAHWADPDSLRFLEFLAPRVHELPALLLCSARPEEWEGPAPLAATASDAAARPLRPAALSEEATVELLSSRCEAPVDASFAAACHAATGGNPFYLHTLVDELRADRVDPTADAASLVSELGPAAVTRTVVTRLARLGEEAAALARALAVLGDGGETGQAAALAGLGPGAVQEAAERLAEAEILADAGRRLSFAHPITRNAVHGDIGARERAELHRRAVALLREAGAAPEYLASHLLALPPAADPEVVKALREAAAVAAGRGAVDSVIAYLRRALEEPPSEDQRIEVLDHLGLAELQSMDDAGIGHLRSALVLSEPDPERHAKIARQLALGLMQLTRPAESIETIRTELERDPGVRVEGRLQLVGEFASIMLFGIDQPLEELDERLAAISDQASTRTPGGRRVLAMQGLRLAQRGQDAGRAAELATGAVDNGLLDDVGPGSTVGFHAWATLVGCGDLEEAERWVTEGLERAREIGHPLGMAMNLNLLSLSAYARGAIVRAASTASDSLRLAREHDIRIGHPATLAAMANALAARGETGTAWRELERDGLTAEPPPLLTSAWLMEARGRLRAADGEHERALEDFELSGELFRRWGATAPGISGWRADAVDSLLALGRHGESRRLAEEDLALAQQFGASHSIGRALRARALTTTGDELTSGLTESARVLAACGARLDEARAVVDLGAAIRRQGRRKQAREPLKRGLDLARSCGAVPLVQRAYDELRAAGARPRKILRTGADALTPSERRVADLAATGLTNREIAQRLFVTKKTVEFHLGQAYRKLEIESREELSEVLEPSSPSSHAGDAPATVSS